ncbi:MAG: VWA domain-containing protein [Alphaproteobacteria bacterium]|nr:VWA domain-containing protein [Alphaproteobacteria bacterium]
MIRFAAMDAFWMLLVPVLVYYILPAAGKMYGDALKVPFVADLMRIKADSRHSGLMNSGVRSSALKMFVMSLAWILAVVALARPQMVGEPHRVHNESRDILLIVDISNSMNERDFVYQNRVYDRLTAVKNVVSRFIDERTEDRIGLVLFGTRAYLQVPLTYDKQSLKEVLLTTDAGMAGNSTSIGDAIGVALKNMVADGKPAENKVLILLTDGENNDGNISFPQAVNLAKQEKIKVYTIGVGSDQVPFFGGLFNVPVSSDLDEAGLTQLARETQGRYFRAKDVQSLFKVYQEINRLEPQEQEGRYVEDVDELYWWPAAAALLLFAVLILLNRKVG